ncbi:MAG: hypothetical protein EAZ67_04380 [Cytophagales bacterium]|nr:MAG: hypothetical protein EAZ67_04380 [Cytophagales bacterium]
MLKLVYSICIALVVSFMSCSGGSSQEGSSDSLKNKRVDGEKDTTESYFEVTLGGTKKNFAFNPIVGGIKANDYDFREDKTFSMIRMERHLDQYLSEKLMVSIHYLYPEEIKEFPLSISDGGKFNDRVVRIQLSYAKMGQKQYSEIFKPKFDEFKMSITKYENGIFSGTFEGPLLGSSGNLLMASKGVFRFKLNENKMPGSINNAKLQ